MSETASNVVTYTPLESGNEESRWIRLEQVQATLPSPSVGYMAELIDLVFKREACDDGMGGGGEEADEQNEPTDEDFAEQLSIVLTETGQCRQGYWLGAVNVYRTHEQPGYELRSETAKVQTVTKVRESYRQVVDVNGPLIALERPYAGNLQGIPKNVNWTVRGATVNLDRPVHDRLTLRYKTWHEHVTLRVPTKRTEDGEEYEPAAVVAFWGDMAAECQLEPPEPEDPENQEAIDELCKKQRPEPAEPSGCWKTVHHYKRCNCSYAVAAEYGWDEQVGAPCDGAPAESQVGYEEKFDGFVRCPDDEDDYLHDMEYYNSHCCHYPPSVSYLPICRKSYRLYRGGHKIENGPEHWKAFYGDNVRMIAVTPEQGYCGDEITEWNVPQRNCCDGVPPLVACPSNPKQLTVPEHKYDICVMDGKQGVEHHWRTTGGLKIWPAKTTELRTKSKGIKIYFEEGLCPNPTVRVSDGCSELEMTFEGPENEPPILSETDMALGAEARFALSVEHGVPPFMWMASGGIKMLSYSPTGRSAVFETGESGEWCVGNVTVVDACGRDASCTIRNANTGRWSHVSVDDQCQTSYPVGEYDPPLDVTLPSIAGNRTLAPAGGYIFVTRLETRGSTGSCNTTVARCGPMNAISPQFKDTIAAFCQNKGRDFDESCGCKYTTVSGTNAFIMWSEFIVSIRRWNC